VTVSTARGDVARFARSSAVYAAGNAINRLGAFVLLPVYTRYLAVAEYGQIELFYVIASIASGLLSVGIAHATLRFYHEHQDPADRHEVVSTNLIAAFVIGAAGVGLVALAAAPLARNVFGDESLKVGVWIVLASLVLELSSQVCLAFVRAKERAGIFVAVSVGKLLVQVAVNTYMLAVLHAGVLGVLAGNLATVAVAWLVLCTFTLRHCGLRFSWAKLMPVLKYGYPFLLSTIVGLVATNVDRVWITSLLSFQALGIYALATKFSNLLTELIAEPFNQAYGAFRFSIMGQANAGEIQALVVRYLLIVACFGALGLSFFVGPLLHLIATPEYYAATRYVPLLALAAIFKLLGYPAQTGILYHKHTRHIFHVGVAGAVVGTVAGLVLIAWLGILGACIAAVITAGATLSLTHRYSQRYFPVRYDYARLTVILASAVLLFAATLPLEGLPGWAMMPIKALLVLLYLPLLAALKAIDPAEISRARETAATRWRALAGPRRAG
jgi:O-antigen/teichoic acid export membrane protein